MKVLKPATSVAPGGTTAASFACASSRHAGATREMFSGSTMSCTRASLSFAISAAYASMALNVAASFSFWNLPTVSSLSINATRIVLFGGAMRQ